MAARNAYLQKYMDQSRLPVKNKKKKKKRRETPHGNVVIVDTDVVAPSRALKRGRLEGSSELMYSDGDGDDAVPNVVDYMLLEDEAFQVARDNAEAKMEDWVVERM